MILVYTVCSGLVFPGTKDENGKMITYMFVVCFVGSARHQAVMGLLRGPEGP